MTTLSKPKKVLRPEVWSISRKPRGYVGPCCHADCDGVADTIVEVSVNGVVMNAWVCPDHREAIGA